MHTTIEAYRLSDGSLASFTWPGHYPLAYLCGDGGTLCPDCANMAEAEGLADDPYDPQWFLVAGFMHLEGAPEICDHCGAEVESAYGDPDEEEAL